MIAARGLGWALLITAGAVSLGCDRSSPLSGSGPNQQPSVGAQASGKIEDRSFVTLTPSAVQELRRIVKDFEITETWYVRLRVLPGSCVGFQHKLDMETNVSTSEDFVSESAGIKVVVLKRHVEMVRGAQIDFLDKPDKRGFSVTNPNFEGEALKKWLPILSAEALPVPPLNKDQLTERIGQFRKMTSEDPESELGHFRLGQLLMEDGQYGEAVKSFERTLELSPQFSKVYQLLGECLIKLDRKERAIEVLTKGWSVADKRGDEAPRDAMRNLLTDLGAAIPQEPVKKQQ
jgi:iron-sulfur cluster assembly accessory protein